MTTSKAICGDRVMEYVIPVSEAKDPVARVPEFATLNVDAVLTQLHRERRRGANGATLTKRLARLPADRLLAILLDALGNDTLEREFLRAVEGEA